MKIKAPSHGTVIAYLALFMAMSGTAVAATGGTFILGRSNAASTQTVLTNSGTGPVLALSTRTGQAPLAVSASSGKATNLSADKIDGLDSSAFARSSALSGLQRRVGGICGAGMAMTGVNADGTVTCTQLAPPPPAPAPAQSRDKGFAIADLQVRAEGFGDPPDWEGVARITNENSTTRSANFTVTVFRNNSVIATLRGTVSDLAPGATNTVDLFSTDDWSAGDYTTTFQVDTVV